MSDPVDARARRAMRRVGQVLRNKWRLDSLLGVGGMAAVYAATHRNGKRGAVKMLHPELSSDEEARRRFLREGYAANKVDHPGAVSVLDDDVAEDGSVFLVMELLDGETVEARATARPGARLAPGEAIAIGVQLLDALAAAHDRGIVHRDIKPENVFLTTAGQIKVLDFGIARLLDVPGTGRATRTGSAMGTPAFMPPEQALGDWKLVDARTDVWAASATLFTLLTGRLVHEADTVNKLLLAAMTRPAPRLSSVLPDLPEALAAVLDRGLAFERDQRWPDARAMRDALRACAGPSAGTGPLTPAIRPATPTLKSLESERRAGGSSGEDRPPVNIRIAGASTAPVSSDPPTRPRRGVRDLVVVGALGLGLVLGGTTYFLTRGARARAPAGAHSDAATGSPPGATVQAPPPGAATAAASAEPAAPPAVAADPSVPSASPVVAPGSAAPPPATAPPAASAALPAASAAPPAASAAPPSASARDARATRPGSAPRSPSPPLRNPLDKY